MRKNSGRGDLSFDLQDYGAMMKGWAGNSGPGDSIYAVSSYASDGEVPPDREMLESALVMLHELGREARSSANKTELQNLILQTQEILKKAPMHKNARGIYHGTAAQEDDYVIHKHSTSGLYYVDRVGRNGTSIKAIGKAAPSLKGAVAEIRKEALRRGYTSGLIFEQRGDELAQIGQVKRGTGMDFESNARVDGNPEPKFKIGDLVEDIDGTRKGRVEHIRGYDDLLRGYRYMVRDTGGSRLNWNEANMRRQRGHSKNGSPDLKQAPNARRKPKLRSEIDSPEVREEVEALAAEQEPHTIRAHFEHGHWWATCPCGASWSVVDVETRGEVSLELERVDSGDEDYHQDDEDFDDRYRNNVSREAPDVQAARELSLYIENEYDLVGAPNSQGKAIEKNLLKKIKAGTFDLALSEKAWMYLMETGAKKYCKEYADPKEWSKVFNKPTRELVAHEFATTFAAEHGAKSLTRNGFLGQGERGEDDEGDSGIETEEFDAPAHWASAFINGDTSGLEEEDLAEFEAWVEANPELGNVVDVSEDTHFGRWNGLQTDLATYTAHVQGS